MFEAVQHQLVTALASLPLLYVLAFLLTHPPTAGELGPELLTMGGMTYLMAHQPGYVTPITNQMPPAIQDLQARAANDPLFAQALSKKSDDNTATGESSTIVPFARPAPAQPVIAPQQTISITINAAPGATAQDIAAEVQRVLREENRRAEAKYRGRAYD